MPRGPSRTAVMIGENLIFMSGDPEIAPLLPAGAAEYTERLLVAAGMTRPWFIRLFRRGWFRRFVSIYERMIAKGMTVHLALRKRFVEDETRAGLARGAPQVLVVGAGFDTLCARLAPEYPEVTFVEIDHPETQAVKRRAIDSLGAFPRNLKLVGADLSREDLLRVLIASGWRQDVASVVIAEGLLMYLERRAVLQFLDAVHRAVAADSTLLFTYMKSDRRGRVDGGQLGWLNDIMLAIKGEPYRWSVRDGELGPLLHERGYELDGSPERCDFRRRYLTPAGLAERPLGRVELVGVARVVGG